MPSFSLNAVCPYFAMFPLDFPLRVLGNDGNGNKWVFDPFCGRGTTNFAARLRGLPSVGIDSSPVAAAIAEAKAVTASSKDVVECAKAILSEARIPNSVPDEPFWEWAYSETTLIQVCCLREELIRNCTSPERIVLRALVLGALHGPQTKGLPSYFSNQCPRTFAPKPAYAVKFWSERSLRPPLVDVLGVIKRRAERFLSERLPEVPTLIVQQDSRSWIREELKNTFSWIITSPPYYGLRTYVQDQWLRNWFMGGSSQVNYESSPLDLQHSSPDYFSQQLKQVWRNAAIMSKSDARLVCRFGGIHNRKQDCIDILKASLRDSGWRLTTIRSAGSALDGRRQAAQFGNRQREHPRKEYDAYARRDL